MPGTNPIRGGMYTSVRPDACSQYGSSSVQMPPVMYYTGGPWCTVGVLLNEGGHGNSVFSLEAQFDGTRWNHRARDPISTLFINFGEGGSGTYGAFRDGDSVQVPGKHGRWAVQVQPSNNAYLLYIP